ncbi:MAG TPA: 1-phosphofructokinase [Candidatus Fimimorpha faecalis]|uniref:Tagatose-6-phosphate kinase n=1 Tax=Candidatus Fimimorpha faecalis TaxID=2840824 RepID=A0A9D1ECZ7_9FIRM|nr:1-phosphofructokinase [Candidatus Fimimorpha faecalis]
MIYTVTFNPAIDYVVRMDQFILDTVNRTTAEEIYYGGKGINVSTVLKELGQDSVALGFIAGFTGNEIAQGLKNQGIQTDFICLKEGLSRINVKIKAQQETEINGQGPHIDAEALEALFQKLDLLEKGDVLILAGSIPSSMPEDSYEQIMKRMDGKGILTVVDATKNLLVNVLKYHPFLVKPNNHELGEIFQTVLKTSDEIVEAAKKLQQMGARNVLISMAGDGAILVAENGEIHQIGVPKGTVQNSVGAGDSMVAGFIAGYLEKKDYLYALRLGTASGSATAFSKGLAVKEEIERLLQEV